MDKRIDTGRVLRIAKAAGRHNAFRWSVDNYVGDGKRISPMTDKGYSGRRNFASASTSDVVRHSAGALTFPRARYHLKKLAAAGFLKPDNSPNWTSYYFDPADVDAWFAEALQFYLDAGLSLTEIRQVELPAIPEVPESPMADTSVFEWHESFHRECRMRVAPCPARGKPSKSFRYEHALTVAPFNDNLSHVYCTCGWEGPGAPTDEAAVKRHNEACGVGTEQVTPWRAYPHDPTSDATLDELPF